MRLRAPFLTALVPALLLTYSATLSDPAAPEDRRRGELTWLADWGTARAVAAGTGRPILLVFGVPAYESVPDLW